MKRTTAVGHSYTAEELDELFRSGTLERIGMGSRRSCYRLPCGKLCVKCYRSDEEILEGKIQGRSVKPLPRSVVREIRSYRFDERNNTSCQEYRYWESLRMRLPKDLMAVFPESCELLKSPSRGWCLIEELIVSSDGSAPQSVHKNFLEPPSLFQKEVESAFRILVNRLAECRVRLYDPSNVMIQKSNGGFNLRLADLEPANRNLIPLDSVFPWLIGGRVRRRAERFLAFTKDFRTKQRLDHPTAALYAIRNNAGRVLVAWTDVFTQADPDLAVKVIPVPLDRKNDYLEPKDSALWRSLQTSSADNECAWMFYPSKRDDVRTVFFREDGRLFVKKTVLSRAFRPFFRRFRQREVSPLPIFKGKSAADDIRDCIRNGDCEGASRRLAFFIKGLVKSFPLSPDGRLPPCTFDAVPQNCIISDDGEFHFFDLEYDMRGGVPLMYVIFRSMVATLYKIPARERRGFNFRKCMAAVADQFNVSIDEAKCHRINASIKRFNSLGFCRILTNVWLSLLPVRSWRLRFCWWSMIPKTIERR